MKLPLLFLPAFALCLTGCARIENLLHRDATPGYGDVAFKGTPVPPKPRVVAKPRPVCSNVNDVRIAQNDPACVGTVLRGASAAGPTITVLEPGLALPPAPLETETLAAPAR